MMIFMLQALLINHFVTERLHLLYPTTIFIVELVDWVKHPALTNLIYVAQLTHCSACVNRSECGAPCAPLSNQATALRSSQLRFAFLSILSLLIANIKAYFSFFLSRRAIKQCVGKNSVWRSVVNYVKQSVATLT